MWDQKAFLYNKVLSFYSIKISSAEPSTKIGIKQEYDKHVLDSLNSEAQLGSCVG